MVETRTIQVHDDTHRVMSAYEAAHDGEMTHEEFVRKLIEDHDEYTYEVLDTLAVDERPITEADL